MHRHGDGDGHAHGHAHAHHSARASLTSKAAIASVAMAVILVTLKVWATWSTGSVAMLGSLADTALDLFASLVTFFSVRYAAQPADAEHRFGHGKAEALSALFQVGLIIASALAIGWRAAARLGTHSQPDAPELGIGVSVIAIVLTLVLLAYQRSVIRRTGSIAISTDHTHYQSDLLLNGAVIVALALDSMLGVRGVDPFMGLAIAAWLLWGAFQGARLAIDQLMDREWPDERREALRTAALTHPEVTSVHDLRTRTSGGHDFAQFHIWVDPAISLSEAHRIMHEVEERVLRDFPLVDMIIHPDPEGHRDRHPIAHDEGGAVTAP